MAIIQEDIVDIDLNRGTVFRSFLNHSIGEADWKGNRYGFRCLRGSEQESVAGFSCIGYFIRADGNTIVISGTVEGNKAYVDLPETCYAVEGGFTLAIKLSDGTQTGTIRIVDGTVVNTSNGSIIDPGSVVPDLTDIMAVIGRIEAAAEEIEKIHISNQQISGTRYRIVVTIEE
jgi:hypothetical protein